MSRSPTARQLDREIGSLTNDSIGDNPMFVYQRYNLELTERPVKELLPTIDGGILENLSAMDDPDNMGVLHQLGGLFARRFLQSEHFPGTFDLK